MLEGCLLNDDAWLQNGERGGGGGGGDKNLGKSDYIISECLQLCNL